MASCFHDGRENFMPDEIADTLPECQAGTGRHKCAICAYNHGLNDDADGSPFESCDSGHAAAPLAMLAGLPEAQSGRVRHKCCYTAWQEGVKARPATDEIRALYADTQLYRPIEALSATEKKTYVLHRKIERKGNTGEQVKRRQGYTCKACDFNFEARYGGIGRNFIEAHHLFPLSALKEDETREYNFETDFTVLCANCHRMIHRMEDPSDLDGLKEKLKTADAAGN